MRPTPDLKRPGARTDIPPAAAAGGSRLDAATIDDLVTAGLVERSSPYPWPPSQVRYRRTPLAEAFEVFGPVNDD